MECGSSMICIECGREIPDNLKFCKYCGAPVKQKTMTGAASGSFCKGCGSPLKEGVVFCTQCGTPVGGTSEPIINRKYDKQSVSKKGNEKKDKTGNVAKIFIGVLTGISLFLVGFIVIYFVNKMDGNNYIPKETAYTETESDQNAGGSQNGDEKSLEDDLNEEETSLNASVDMQDQNQVADGSCLGIDAIVGKINTDKDSIVDGIASGKYTQIQIDSGITAYIDSNNQPVSVSAGRGYGNDQYSRELYYENGELFFAEYIGDDLQQFYFDKGELVRWRYCADASARDKGTDYDGEETASYVKWNQIVDEDSNGLVSQLEFALQSQQEVEVNPVEIITEQVPFYGVWCIVSLDFEEAKNILDDLIQQGFTAKMFRIAEEDSVSSENGYAVTTGLYDTEKKAKKALKKVKGRYPNAYIKYSEDWNSEFVISDSDKRYITEDDVKLLTQREVRTALNELYARHGRKFTDLSWQEYFNSKSWYDPKIEPDDFSDSTFNNFELENKKFLVEWEEDHGWR